MFLSRLAIQADASPGSWLPKAASTQAESVDSVFAVITFISVVFLVGIVGAMLWFVVKYRRRPGRVASRKTHHHTWLEITWSAIPALLLLVIFAVGLTSFMGMATPLENAYEIQVNAKRWVWSFQYPNGYVDDKLHVPVDTPVQLVMKSDSGDVIHSLYIPAFRTKRDVIPGRYTKMWFEAKEVGEYDLFCAEYCGTKHSDMITSVVVHPSGEFERWLEKASNFLETMTPVDAGELLYRRRGCAQCHSVDGGKMVGPTFQNLFGSDAQLDDGTSLVVDEDYIRESILQPQKKARAGYRKVMPTYQGQLKEAEIDAIIAYIKSLNQD